VIDALVPKEVHSLTLEIKEITMYAVYVWDSVKRRWNLMQNFDSEFKAAECAGELIDNGFETTVFHQTQN
jgi:hypothetical protein